MTTSPRPDLSEPPSGGAHHGSDTSVFAAVDIGASSGRVVAGWWTGSTVELEVVHRFPNGAREIDGHLRWDATGLYAEVLVGLRKLASRFGTVASVGIDTWAVDYGLLDAGGELLAEPIAYRDSRTEAGVAAVHALIDPERLYAINGLQFLPFNTLYQLAAEPKETLTRAAQALLLPDLLAYWLTGKRRTEVTNASTTGLLDATARTFAAELEDSLGIPRDLFPPLVQPGETVGTLTAGVAGRTGLPARTPVVAVGSHDTASAVVGVPATNRRFAYVSSGTWSLVGLELDAPVLSPASRAANFTNEGGVDGRVRYLRNVGGLWLLSESVRTWREAGTPADQEALLAEAARLPVGGPVVDVDAPEFLPPGDMPARIHAACRASRQPPPEAPAAVVRCILDSLAHAYARTAEQAESLSGQTADVVHIVGGGCQNQLLCQLTADLAQRPVLAGPVEATALGNVAVQARAAGLLPASLDDLRIVLQEGMSLSSYAPRRAPRPYAATEAVRG